MKLKTKVSKNEEYEYFDWDKYWKIVGILAKIKILKFFAFLNFKAYEKLLEEFELSKPDVLELGAGSGLISEMLIRKYGGRALLIDNNPRAYFLFGKKFNKKLGIIYLLDDVFELKLKKKFDIVISGGLIEHFRNKRKILEIHKNAVKKRGKIIIFIPHRSYINRLIQKLVSGGYEELMRKKELISILEKNGLKVLKTSYSFFHLGAICEMKNSMERG